MECCGTWPTRWLAAFAKEDRDPACCEAEGILHHSPLLLTEEYSFKSHSNFSCGAVVPGFGMTTQGMLYQKARTPIDLI